MTVGLKDCGVVLSGDLYGQVDIDSSVWTITDNKMYVYYPLVPIGKVWIYQLMFVCLFVCN